MLFNFELVLEGISKCIMAHAIFAISAFHVASTKNPTLQFEKSCVLELNARTDMYRKHLLDRVFKTLAEFT